MADVDQISDDLHHVCCNSHMLVFAIKLFTQI